MLLQDLHDFEPINYKLVVDLKQQVHNLNKRVEELELSNAFYKISAAHLSHTFPSKEPHRIPGFRDSDYHGNHWHDKQVEEAECLPTSLPPPPRPRPISRAPSLSPFNKL